MAYTQTLAQDGRLTTFKDLKGIKDVKSILMGYHLFIWVLGEALVSLSWHIAWSLVTKEDLMKDECKVFL